jgi:Indole-3-glycerol phosphate synthase
MPDTPNILSKILRHKSQEIAERASRESMRTLLSRVESAPRVRGFKDCLKRRIATGRAAVIAEIKKASPSQGILREPFAPAAIAKRYEQGGAACLSVLTDREFFQGSEAHLREAREACALPILRKDFIIDPYQIYEARVIGADAILLIIAALRDTMLRELASLAAELGMNVLLEVHDAAELERALKLNAFLIGINNRDLCSFSTNLRTTIDLVDRIPPGYLVVTESGIHSPEDVALMRAHGINAFLVGEAFMRATDPGAKLGELFGDVL